MATRASARNKPKETPAQAVEEEIKEDIEEIKDDMDDDDCQFVDEGVNEEDAENDEEDAENDEEDENAGEGDDGEKDESENRGGSRKKVTETTQEAKDALAANLESMKLDVDNLSIDEILLIKVTLDDGTEQFVFSRGPKYSDDRWPINCHLCRLGNLYTEENVKLHLKGKGHAYKLKRRAPMAKFYSEPFYQALPKNSEEKPIKIYPGEIIEDLTEEYADRIITKDEFQVKLPDDPKLVKQLQKEHIHEYNNKLPLLGLCYVYKMMGYQGVTYFCTLCSLKIKKEAFQHIVGSDHQFKYINRHFPKFYEKVYGELKSVQSIDTRFCIRNIFRKLYRKIENIKGFRKITICDDKDFFAHRKKFLLKTRFDEHYDENTIMITDQEIDVLIRKCINGMQFIKPDVISLENPNLGLRLTFQDEKMGGQRNRGGFNDNYGGGGGGGGGGGVNDYIRHDFNRVLAREIEDLNQEYTLFERFPRKHPKYKGEHNKFTSFKKDGKDKKEFSMNWNTYWRRRLRVLYENELTKRKIRIKRTFGLRPNMRTPSPPRDGGGYGGWNNNQGAGYGRGYGRGDGYNQGYGNDYGRGYDDYYGNNQQSAVANLMLAMMQNAGNNGGGGGNMRGNNGGGGGDYGMGRNNNHHNMSPSEQDLPASNEPLGVISVLRLFNALENQLGSLGPQAVQLLSQAVLVEKNNQNPNDLMMEKEFYIFFATGREKLKGQYFANVIEPHLIPAVKKTIQDATILMEMFEDYCKRTGKNLPQIDEYGSRGGGGGGDNWKSGMNDGFKNGNKNNYDINDPNSRPFANDDFFDSGNRRSGGNNDRFSGNGKFSGGNQGFSGDHNDGYSAGGNNNFSIGGSGFGGYSTGNNDRYNRNQNMSNRNIF